MGSDFWDRVYEKAYQEYGTTEVPVDTYNKVWIVPDVASIYVNGTNAFIVSSKLKVMLEEDYLALETNKNPMLRPSRELYFIIPSTDEPCFLKNLFNINSSARAHR